MGRSARFAGELPRVIRSSNVARKRSKTTVRAKGTRRTCRQSAWKGKTGMNPTDNRDRDAGLAGQRFAMRDVRFAGTVAAGLVAGVLGVGALTAPLLGWTEWPSSPAKGGDEAGTVTLHSRPSASPIGRLAPSAIGSGTAAIAPIVLP